MKKIIYFFFLGLIVPTFSLAEEFDRKVPSLHIKAECDAATDDERGPFGIVYQEGELTHDFLVMTGVHFDTCKELERKITALKKKYRYLILQGSGKTLYTTNNYYWRWRSIRTVDRKKCLSYFVHDCE